MYNSLISMRSCDMPSRYFSLNSRQKPGGYSPAGYSLYDLRTTCVHSATLGDEMFLISPFNWSCQILISSRSALSCAAPCNLMTCSTSPFFRRTVFCVTWLEYGMKPEVGTSDFKNFMKSNNSPMFPPL